MVKEFIRKDGKSLQLTEYAIEHIVNGDFVFRPMGNKRSMKVLKGGLHTYNAWVKFKKNHTDKLEHVHFYNSSEHELWYYARELSNGVITLRIPKELFSGKAAKITMYPDDYYKSGYLWKTLFPKSYDKNEIVNIIQEVLDNEIIDEGQSGQIVGFINNSDPLSKIKVVIQYRGKDIKSVFPSWTQPNSGNDGKPYSHFDNIGFVISQSTEYFDDVEKKHSSNMKIMNENLTFESILDFTPLIFKKRLNPKCNESISSWKKKRIKVLSRFGDDETDFVFRYLNEFSLVKYYPEITSSVYATDFDKLSSIEIYNTFNIVQNFIDGLDYLYIKKKYDMLIVTIEYILKNMVSHTLFDLLSKKRILSKIISIVVSYNVPEMAYKFLVALSNSPIRREAYIEYNLDSIYKKKIKTLLPLEDFPTELYLIKNPSLDINIRLEDYFEILKEVLGETYTLNFKEDELNKILCDIISSQRPNFYRFLNDSLDFFNKEDFLFFSENIGDMLTLSSKFNEEDTKELSLSIGVVLRDYSRIQFAHRQRINARYIEYFEYVDVFYYPVDINFLFGTILKHERWINTNNLNVFLQKISDFSKAIDDKQLNNDVKNFKEKVGKERPPLPYWKK